jgi:N-acetyl-gamma-glutamyl-phosphate reductase
MPDPSVGIVGASGYTGSELVRILSRHPAVRLAAVTSESHAGKRMSDIHPHLEGVCDLELVKAAELGAVDLVFLALPHGASMDFVKTRANGGGRIVDLSGDFRLSSAAVYERWYGKAHACPERLDGAVYGLPELNRDRIAGAPLVANPGCYPTSAILALAPFLRCGLVSPEGLVVDSKSGVTGAGASAKAATHYPSVNEDFKAYGIATHRHTPEISETLEAASGAAVELIFTPHLLPVNRGILTTAYARAKEGVTQADLEGAYEDAYSGEPFVRVRTAPPSIQAVRGSNFCDVFVKLVPETGRVVAVSVIDNLVKGAAGQAVQNMNIMMGIDEQAGLDMVPLSP